MRRTIVRWLAAAALLLATALGMLVDTGDAPVVHGESATPTPTPTITTDRDPGGSGGGGGGGG